MLAHAVLLFHSFSRCFQIAFSSFRHLRQRTLFLYFRQLRFRLGLPRPATYLGNLEILCNSALPNWLFPLSISRHGIEILTRRTWQVRTNFQRRILMIFRMIFQHVLFTNISKDRTIALLPKRQAIAFLLSLLSLKFAPTALRSAWYLSILSAWRFKFILSIFYIINCLSFSEGSSPSTFAAYLCLKLCSRWHVGEVYV